MSYLETIGPLDGSMGHTLVDLETKCAVSWGDMYPIKPKPGMRVGWKYFSKGIVSGEGVIISVKDDACQVHGPTIVVLWSVRPLNTLYGVEF